MNQTSCSLLFALLILNVNWLHAETPNVAPDDISKQPNILFIAIDDQNDWCGPLGGHPLAKTPQLDRLAARGTTFTNAHCNAPLCNPSRTSLLLGLRPSTTGICGLAPSFRSLPEFAQRETLPQFFAERGYHTYGVGKIFHTGPTSSPRNQNTASKTTAGKSDFLSTGNASGIGIKPDKKLIGATPMGDNPLMDWGVFPHQDEQKGDYQVASWAVEQIRNAPRDKPFFIAAGFFLPHVPCYASQKWFDQFPNDARVLPTILEDDREDTPRFSWYLHWYLPEPRLQWLKESDQWINLCRSYLACTSFVDSQIGRLLDALDDAGVADNTIVVVWGDHGWHLGEKGITGKNTLWEDGTRVPLIFAGPGVGRGAKCDQPAELLDIYPTLIELCGLTPKADLEGLSLKPQLTQANTPRDRPAITTHNQGNHAIRSQRYRYIRYADGSEEFYDHQSDPNEWYNVIDQVQHKPQIEAHRKWLPTVDRPPATGSAQRVLTYDADADIATWEGKPVKRDDPIPN